MFQHQRNHMFFMFILFLLNAIRSKVHSIFFKHCVGKLDIVMSSSRATDLGGVLFSGES